VGARDRILDTAYDLFSRHGVRAVGVDRIVAESGVAKMSLYRHFPSKDDLVLTFLQEREQRWTNGWLRAEAERRGDSAAGRMLAIFDVFGEWFVVEDFEGCSFINVLLEREAIAV
jgi:AcrR family transcriptional regulator